MTFVIIWLFSHFNCFSYGTLLYCMMCYHCGEIQITNKWPVQTISKDVWGLQWKIRQVGSRWVGSVFFPGLTGRIGSGIGQIGGGIGSRQNISATWVAKTAVVGVVGGRESAGRAAES